MHIITVMTHPPTPTVDSLIDLDRRALDLCAGAVRRVTVADLDRPTPCSEWTLGDLLAHMTGQHHGFAAAARGQGDDLQHWRVEPLGAGAVDRYLAAAAELVEAFAGSQRDVLALPEISRDRAVPRQLAVGFHLVDYLVHGWDVARSLGLDYRPDPELTAAALPLALAVPDGERRLAPGAAFRPGLAAAGEPHGDLDQILLALGRSPAWPN
jgi:uncharacterized protein (TIGR03086 family)